jgi:hypothetical protein
MTLPPADFFAAQRACCDGIDHYWQRTATRPGINEHVRVGTGTAMVRVTARAARADEAGIRYQLARRPTAAQIKDLLTDLLVGFAPGAIPRPVARSIIDKNLPPDSDLDGQLGRASNWGMVVPGLPIYIPWDPAEATYIRKTAAHEFGHSVLECTIGARDSTRHKGTTGDWMAQEPNGSYPVPAAPAEIDLMKYTSGPGYDYSRTVAVEEDVLGLIAFARIRLEPA